MVQSYEIFSVLSFFEPMQRCSVAKHRQECILSEQRNGPDTPTGITFKLPTTPDELAACYDVIAALRRELRSAEDWIERALRQMDHGYRVLAVWDTNGLVRAVAGYRVAEKSGLRALFLCG